MVFFLSVNLLVFKRIVNKNFSQIVFLSQECYVRRYDIMKLPDEISVDLFECSLLKNIKIRFKNRGHHAVFSVTEVKRSKILQKLNKSYFLCLHSCFDFLWRDLHNKYMIYFVFGSFSKHDHLFIFIILGISAKR